MATGTPADKAKRGQVQGEGDYASGREFDDMEREFVESGKVDEGARKARPKDPAEAAEMEKAEEAGRQHSKGEAPGDLDPKKPRSGR